MAVEIALETPIRRPVIEDGLRALRMTLGRPTENPACGIDCGPGA